MIDNIRKFRLKRAGKVRQKGQEGLKQPAAQDSKGLQASQKSLLKQSRYLEAFFHHSLTPLVFLDREFNFIWVNEAYARAGQKEVDDFPGHNHFEFYPSDAKAIFEEVVRTKQPFQINARPFVYPDHPDWGVTYWDWTLTPLFDDDGAVEVLVFALEDVTIQKRAEIELEKHREQLEELVRERTRELEEANAQLQRDIIERRQTEIRLNYLASFPEQNPNPVMEMDLNGSIRYINPATLKLFPDICEQVQAHPWLADWLTVVAQFQAEPKEPMGSKSPIGTKGPIGTKDTTIRDVMVGERCYQQSFYYSTTERFIRIYGFDITERKRAEEAIEAARVQAIKERNHLQVVERELLAHKESLECARQESEERYQDLFKKSPVAIILHDGVRILEVNPAIGEMLQLENPDELIGTNVLDIVAPECRELISSRIHLFFDQEVSTSSKEVRLLNKVGSSVYAECVSGICRYQGRKVIQVILHDITKRKQLELELQETNSRLHEFTKQMMTTLEEERRMISLELHDEAGQALTALKMYIELILNGVPTDAIELRQRIGEAVKLTDQTLKGIRRLAQDLRPPGLDALGLNFTLEDFCYEFGKRVGLDIKYQGCDLPVLTNIVKISLYRFLQEALTNIVKHSQAGSVEVRLGYHCQRISLEVKDNGIGFELNKMELNRKSIGLMGMQERLSMLGGTLNIDSKAGEGTRLLATIPWEAA